jgi:hypothetical protein
MYPGEKYNFDSPYIIETPMKQNGGSIYDRNDTAPLNEFQGSIGMMKGRMALDSHFGNPTAQRMTNTDRRGYKFSPEEIEKYKLGPDAEGNVYVSSYDNLVTPQIQDVNGELNFIEQPWSKENADRSYEQSLKFENDNDARYFGEHYKEIAPMMNNYKEGGQFNHSIAYEDLDLTDAEIREYSRQGYIIEELPKMKDGGDVPVPFSSASSDPVINDGDVVELTEEEILEYKNKGYRVEDYEQPNNPNTMYKKNDRIKQNYLFWK